MGGVGVVIPRTATASSGKIVVCYSRSQDQAEFHAAPRSGKCGANETTLSWNRIGLRGATGHRGASGAPGATGATGAAGPRGKRGRPGHNGKNSSSSGDNTAVDWATALGSILGALVALILTLWILTLLGLNALTRLPKLKNLDVAKRVRRVSLVVETFDDSALGRRLGPAITGLVRAQMTMRNDRWGMKVSGQRSVSETLKDIQDLSGTVPTAAALIRVLTAALPRRTFVFCGELQPPGTAGPGLSIAMRQNDGYDAAAALWAVPLEITQNEPAAYQRLAIPAAAWADHRMATAFNERLLSTNAVSWAFFRMGLECERIGDDTPARSLYQQALGHDGLNIGALAQLGGLERRAGNYVEAYKLLRTALRVLES